MSTLWKIGTAIAGIGIGGILALVFSAVMIPPVMFGPGALFTLMGSLLAILVGGIMAIKWKKRGKAPTKYLVPSAIGGMFLFSIIGAILSPPPPGLGSNRMKVTYSKTIGMHNCEGCDGSLVKVPATASNDEVGNITFKAVVKVMDEEDGKPVKNAAVTITGCSGAGAAATDRKGVAEVQVFSCTLPANVNKAYFKVRVKKKGYWDFMQEEGIVMARV